MSSKFVDDNLLTEHRDQREDDHDHGDGDDGDDDHDYDHEDDDDFLKERLTGIYTFHSSFELVRVGFQFPVLVRVVIVLVEFPFPVNRSSEFQDIVPVVGR